MHRRRISPAFFVAQVLVLIFAAMLAVPLYYMFVSAFKTNVDIQLNPFAPPTSLEAIDNFTRAIEYASLLRALGNSIYITAGAEFITLLLAVPAAFALARSGSRIAFFVERMFAVGFLIPAFAALVPTAMLSIAMGMFHSKHFLVLFLPATALPLSVILLTQAMKAVPNELREAAMLDGASTFRTLFSVYLPLTMPTLLTTVMLNFLEFWNEYFYALIIAGPSASERTAQVALPALSTTVNSQAGILAAGIVITMLPVFGIYLLFARRMEEAVLSGAVKG